ncbi:hypothetical protein [Streptomyces sp. MMBL 11-3]|uniref:hypothetical protein n=1 Tax=Streptomyces sp. MMBL 11-3 TaxID=3382639 RepID=UPI0039B5F53B
MGWSLEQAAVVKRYMTIASVFAVVGVLFGVFLLASGNSGGWVFLAIIVIPYLGVALFLKNMRKEQPGQP